MASLLINRPDNKLFNSMNPRCRFMQKRERIADISRGYFIYCM